MKPVMQQSLELGSGDCLHACLASILECDIADIPNLSALSKSLADQLANEDAFLASRGLRAIRCHMTGGYESGDVFFVFDGYGIAWGKSPRAQTQHCVVVTQYDGILKIAHDPHPDGIGVSGEFSGVSWIVPQIKRISRHGKKAKAHRQRPGVSIAPAQARAGSQVGA